MADNFGANRATSRRMAIKSPSAVVVRKPIKFKDPNDLFKRQNVRNQVLSIDPPKLSSYDNHHPFIGFLNPPSVPPKTDDLQAIRNQEGLQERRELMKTTGFFASLQNPYEPLGDPITDLEAALNNAFAIPYNLHRTSKRRLTIKADAQAINALKSMISAPHDDNDDGGDKKGNGNNNGSGKVLPKRISHRLKQAQDELLRVRSGIKFEDVVAPKLTESQMELAGIEASISDNDSDTDSSITPLKSRSVVGVSPVNRAPPLESMLSFPILNGLPRNGLTINPSDPSARPPKYGSVNDVFEMDKPIINKPSNLQQSGVMFQTTNSGIKSISTLGNEMEAGENGSDNELSESKSQVADSASKQDGASNVRLNSASTGTEDPLDDPDVVNYNNSYNPLSRESLTSAASTTSTVSNINASKTWAKRLARKIHKFKKSQVRRERKMQESLDLYERFRLENYAQKKKFFDEVMSSSGGNCEMRKGEEIMAIIRKMNSDKREADKMAILKVVWEELDVEVMTPKSREITDKEKEIIEICKQLKIKLNDQVEKWILADVLILGPKELHQLVLICGEDFKIEEVQKMVKHLRAKMFEVTDKEYSYILDTVFTS